MTDLSHPAQFDTEERIQAVGALPNAPLAMPLQVLEAPRGASLFTILAQLRPARTGRVGS